MVVKWEQGSSENSSKNTMGRSPCCDENGLKKGPWTPEEDQKLVQYIQKHGHGSWRALPKLAGMQTDLLNSTSLFLYPSI